MYESVFPLHYRKAQCRCSHVVLELRNAGFIIFGGFDNGLEDRLLKAAVDEIPM